MCRSGETKLAAEGAELGVFLKHMVEGGGRAVRQGRERDEEEISVGGGEEEEGEEMEEEGEEEQGEGERMEEEGEEEEGEGEEGERMEEEEEERAIADAWAALMCLQCLR